jgi:undecaprenyl diphosphate synthase
VPPSPEALAAFFKSKRDRELLRGFDAERIPQHVAVIMDGNGRWAARRGLPRIAGHRAGAKALREVLAAAIELGIGHLTVYSFSSENWNRPRDEVSGLMHLFVEVLERELDALMRMGVRLHVLGREEGIPSATMATFERAQAATAHNDGLVLVVALNYGGRREIADAARRIATQAAAGELDPATVDEHLVAAHLYLPDVPDPDLVIRTSGEMRISNFLLWQIAYSELWVTGVLWPDFSRHDLLRAVVDFQGRERRFGGR